MVLCHMLPVWPKNGVYEVSQNALFARFLVLAVLGGVLSFELRVKALGVLLMEILNLGHFCWFSGDRAPEFFF